MTTYKFPPADKTLYGLTTGTVYEPVASFAWEANGKLFTLDGIALGEPDGVTDVHPAKVGNTVSSVEELEALPNGTVLRDESGAWQKFGGLFLWTGNEALFTSSELAEDRAFTILWLPEGEGEQA